MLDNIHIFAATLIIVSGEYLGHPPKNLTQHEYFGWFLFSNEYQIHKINIDKLLHDSNYDKRQRPGPEGQATQVNFSIYVINIPEINFNRHNGEMTLEMYFRQIWTDH